MTNNVVVLGPNIADALARMIYTHEEREQLADFKMYEIICERRKLAPDDKAAATAFEIRRRAFARAAPELYQSLVKGGHIGSWWEYMDQSDYNNMTSIKKRASRCQMPFELLEILEGIESLSDRIVFRWHQSKNAFDAALFIWIPAVGMRMVARWTNLDHPPNADEAKRIGKILKKQMRMPWYERMVAPLWLSMGLSAIYALFVGVRAEIPVPPEAQLALIVVVLAVPAWFAAEAYRLLMTRWRRKKFVARYPNFAWVLQQ